MRFTGVWKLMPSLLPTLSYLLGSVVALVLILQGKGKAALLAFLGFGGLFLLSLVNSVSILAPRFCRYGVFGHRYVDPFSERAITFPRWSAILAGLNCLTNLVAGVAILCLILALWTALRDQSPA